MRLSAPQEVFHSKYYELSQKSMTGDHRPHGWGGAPEASLLVEALMDNEGRRATVLWGFGHL